MFEKLKKRWNLTSNFQVVIILIVFSITGSAALYVRKGIFDLIGITEATSLWIKVPLYIVTVVPAYQVLFLLFASIFGQFRFAWEFEKKTFSRLIPKKK
ncbi:DUF6787 family protein [Draconibacterium halophilum]|uniref:Prolipoprotein diacylglyceryl transferase n=1 Tax=Draconibacterium halophilum TaxID=2706887 RepID=A0A6C0RBH8_9BACT|nr:DUF6787 family protein [Draconibacterium halophilum]QIA07804.1 prolipoprotein diacylglyceryl transferase [Draconibacterium halophilum]